MHLIVAAAIPREFFDPTWLVVGWVVTALALVAGVAVWAATMRRLARRDRVAQPPSAGRGEELAQAGAPVPHTPSPAVPTHAHKGSVLFATGAGVLCVAVALFVGVFARGWIDYAGGLGVIGVVLFMVALYHAWIVHRRSGALRPFHVAYWPLFLTAMLAAFLARPFWLCSSLWVWWTALWIFGIPAALVVRWLRRRPRWALIGALAPMLLLMFLFGRGVAAAGWLVGEAVWWRKESLPTVLVGERSLCESVRLLQLLRLPWWPEMLIRCGRRAVPALSEALRDADTCFSAAYTLGKIGDPRAITPFIEALGDDNPDVRRAAARGLGTIGDKRAIEPLIAALKDMEVRVYAAGALGRLGDRRAIEPLLAALGDDNPDVRQCAAVALKKLTGQDFGRDPAAWRAWWEANRERILEEFAPSPSPSGSLDPSGLSLLEYGRTGEDADASHRRGGNSRGVL